MYFKQNHVLKNFMYLVLVVLPLFSFGLANHGLWSADEPRVAEIGREMALTGNWAVPNLNQRPFLEEPPLYYGLLAIVFKTLGISDKVARIPSAVFAFATVLVVFFIANFLFGPRVALISGIILATTSEYFRVAHTVIVDSVLTFFVVSSMGFFMFGYLSDGNRKKLLFYILLYISCSLSFFTKGFIGVVIPGLGILAFLVAERNIREILTMRLWLGILIFLAMAAPWFIALWHQGGTEYLKTFLVDNHLLRFLPGSFSREASGHHHPFYYYLIEFPIGFLPWSLLLIPVFIHAFSKSAEPATLSAKGRLFAKSWFFAGIVFLSIASTKRALYLMPVFAPIAMLTSLFIESTLASKTADRISMAFLWAFSLALAAIGVGAITVYYYAKGVYPWIGRTNLFLSVVMLSLFLVVFSFSAILLLRHGKLIRYWAFNSASILAGLLFFSTMIMPLVDRQKSFVPFCREVMATVPAREPLYAYSPDETLRGAIPFYTGRYLTEIRDLEKMEQIILGKEQLFIVTRDKKKKAEKELLSNASLSIVFQSKMDIDRTLSVFKKNALTDSNKALFTQKVKN